VTCPATIRHAAVRDQRLACRTTAPFTFAVRDAEAVALFPGSLTLIFEIFPQGATLSRTSAPRQGGHRGGGSTEPCVGALNLTSTGACTLTTFAMSTCGCVRRLRLDADPVCVRRSTLAQKGVQPSLAPLGAAEGQGPNA
jgi:hypothetical protein